MYKYVGLERSGSAVRLLNQTPGKQIRQSTTSPMWGNATPADHYTNFGLLRCPTDIIICTKFSNDQLRVFFILQSAENGHFLYLATRPYNFASTTVQQVIICPVTDQFLPAIGLY